MNKKIHFISLVLDNLYIYDVCNSTWLFLLSSKHDFCQNFDIHLYNAKTTNTKLQDMYIIWKSI